MHGENRMNTVNFNQILCKNISRKAENINGVFDTLVCEKGTNSIYILVLSTQILENSENNYDKYYYRIILRQLGNIREDVKNYRVDSDVIWNNETDTSESDTSANQTKHKTTRPGTSQKLIIEYEHDFDAPGHYEIDLYVKKMAENDTLESCDDLKVKELDLMSICPFNVIFTN